jgi:hypothetical protein
MSVTAISPVSFLNATSLIDKGQPQAQEDSEKAKAQTSLDVLSSGSAAVAVQAFTAFQPDVQPIAILSPTSDVSQELRVGADLSGSTAQWSGGMVDVYA